MLNRLDKCNYSNIEFSICYSLLHIVKTDFFKCSQNLSLPGSQTGKFQNTLKLITKHASEEFKILQKQAPYNTTYCSKTIQNEIIDVMGKYIIGRIVTPIRFAI